MQYSKDLLNKRGNVMKCFYHPDRDAVTTCSECGQPVCGDCNYVARGHYAPCRNCWEKRGSACRTPVSGKLVDSSRPGKGSKPEKAKVVMTAVGGLAGAAVAIPLAFIGLIGVVFCLILFPFGLLGLPFTIGFFIPLMMMLGWVGGKATRAGARKTAEKVIRGESVQEDVMIYSANLLLESKEESDQHLGRVLQEELEREGAAKRNLEDRQED